MATLCTDVHRRLDLFLLFDSVSGCASTQTEASPQCADYSTDIQTLHAQIAQMQTEMETMKKQMSQIVAFIKKKLD